LGGGAGWVRAEESGFRGCVEGKAEADGLAMKEEDGDKVDNSIVMVEFTIHGDEAVEDFDPQIITERLKITPTRCWKKNTNEKPKVSHIPPWELPRPLDPKMTKFTELMREAKRLGKPQPRWFSFWKIDTGYQESRDINVQLLQIYHLLKDKINVLNELKSEYDLTYQIGVVPKIYNGETPALWFDHYIIEFAYKIHAKIDVDQYIFS
jgi:hypothetical protein